MSHKLQRPATPSCLEWIMHVDGALGQAVVLICGHCVGARGLVASGARISSGIKGYLLIWSQRVSWPALGFHLAPGGYLTDMESDSSMTVWSVPGFRISGFECRWNPLRKSTGKSRVSKFQSRQEDANTDTHHFFCYLTVTLWILLAVLWLRLLEMTTKTFLLIGYSNDSWYLWQQ